MRITFQDVQRNVAEIANRQDYSIDALYELMAAYGRSASSITKLRNGVINLTEDKENTVLQRGIVYLKHVKSAGSYPAEVEKLEQDPLTARYNPRFLIATDFKTFAAKDTKKGTTLEISWEDIDRNVDFFYGWTGDEVTDEKTEAVADRRAADKMKELYYEIEKINRNKLAEKGNTFRHDLNVFFTRLLFCFFAEDTKVFSKEKQSIFTGAIKDYTQTDGSDLDDFLNTLFSALDSEDQSAFTSPFSNFPYVNGTLFDTTRNIAIPKFNAQARKYILDCGSLNWSEINPDIFGSMFQSIVDEEHRATHGQHYTSVPNIMKTIEPLFLDKLRDEFDKYYDNPTKLSKLHNRISKIKVFDPACGSGNFLIIAYKELRKLEHAIIERLYEEDYKKAALAGKLSSSIDLNNFYGIEIDDFACEIAVLSLYLAKHQMNIEFEKQFGKEIKLIPLKDKANIVKGNAAALDWKEVCPNIEHTTEIQKANKQSALIEFEDDQSELELGQKYWDEIYLISNPPYLGSRNQDQQQKNDLKNVLSKKIDKYKVLDYVAIWFVKGVEYIDGNPLSEFAFVATSSLFQGDQISIIWPYLSSKAEIGFAHRPFKWTNNATNSAGVTCVVVGFRNYSNSSKYIFDKNIMVVAKNINPYLAEGDSIVIKRRKKPLAPLPEISAGNYTGHAQNLTMSEEEYNKLIDEYPDSKKFIKRLLGSSEFIRGELRWCLWIKNEDLEQAIKIPAIANRIESVKKARLASRDPSANKLASRPHQFRDLKETTSQSVIIPIVSSERRKYIPIGLIDKNTIISNKLVGVYDSDLYVFSLVSSLTHMSWVKAITGRLGTSFSYSSEICYNSFPVRHLTQNEREDLTQSARNILFCRENYSEKTLAELYDPDKMPEDLREAHHKNDLLVDRLYRQKPYENDEERLADLFALYEEMTEREKK